MDTIIEKPLSEWIKLYGKKLIGARTHIKTAGIYFQDGATIVDVVPSTGIAMFKSFHRAISSAPGNGDLVVGIYTDSTDFLPQKNFIRNQVRQRLASLQKLEI
jgi:hypothetical protein